MNKITFNLGLLSVVLAGCASNTPNYDAKFGDAVRDAKLAQTLNANTPVSTDPVLGLDGKAAASAQDRYQESFKTPPQTFEITTSK
jgi:hypothetical protein